MNSSKRFLGLLEPGYIGSVRTKNRILKTGSTLGFYPWEDGNVQQKVIDSYEALAKGGAGLVKVEVNTLEAALNRMKPAAVRRRAPQVKRPAAVVRSSLSSTVEEYCLNLLLQYPELKDREEEIPPEYFEVSENREIFNRWQADDSAANIREGLDPALHEHYDSIINRKLPSTNNIEQRYTDCLIELNKKYLKNLAAKKAQSGEISDEDMRIGDQLREVYTLRSRKGREARR